MKLCPARGFPLLLIIWILFLAVGCGTQAAPAARQVHRVAGFDQPESVQYDPRQDVYFVSSMAGYGSVKDGIGYISWFGAEDPTQGGILVQSGVSGVRLDSPKGLALQGDTLWVADIDVVRGFHRRTGVPLAAIDLAPHEAVLLNAIAVGPDGTLYVSDSGIIMSPDGVLYPGGDKVFAVKGGVVTILAEGADLRHPNGIRWNPEAERLVIAGFHPFGTEAYGLRPGDSARPVLARGPGRFDGVGILSGGRMLLTSWTDSTLYLVENGEQRPLIHDLWQPADIGIDTRRNRVAIPLVLPGLVEVWELPER